MTAPNHYAVLGIGPGATTADIRDAYVRRLKESHPDLDPRGTYPSARVQDLQRAYRCLRDPGARALHDAELHAAELVRARRLRRTRRRLVARDVASRAPRGHAGRRLDAKARWRRVLLVALLAAAGMKWLAWI